MCALINRTNGIPHGVSYRVRKHCTRVHPQRFYAIRWWLWCDSWHRTVRAAAMRAREQRGEKYDFAYFNAFIYHAPILNKIE